MLPWQPVRTLADLTLCKIVVVPRQLSSSLSLHAILLKALKGCRVSKQSRVCNPCRTSNHGSSLCGVICSVSPWKGEGPWFEPWRGLHTTSFAYFTILIQPGGLFRLLCFVCCLQCLLSPPIGSTGCHGWGVPLVLLNTAHIDVPLHTDGEWNAPNKCC